MALSTGNVGIRTSLGGEGVVVASLLAVILHLGTNMAPLVLVTAGLLRQLVKGEGGQFSLAFITVV